MIQVAWVALGLGAIAMLRSVGPRSEPRIAFSFAESILALWGPIRTSRCLPPPTALFDVDIRGGFGAFVPGGDLSLPHAVAIIVGWTLLGLGLTWWGLQRRDA